MSKYLIIIIYLIFISLGLPDSLFGSGWPEMRKDFDVDSSYAGYISMTISAMTIISSLFSAEITSRLKEKWVVIISIGLTVLGILLFSFSKNYWNLFLFSIPYGLGAGSIDASMNNFVAVNYSSRAMNFLNCFYGVGTTISPNIMALALKYKSWKEGYRWTAYIQIGILVICCLTLPLWNSDKENKKDKNDKENEIEKNKDNANKSDAKIIKINEIENFNDNDKDTSDSRKEFKNQEAVVNEQNKNIKENKSDKKDNAEEEKVKPI